MRALVLLSKARVEMARPRRRNTKGPCAILEGHTRAVRRKVINEMARLNSLFIVPNG